MLGSSGCPAASGDALGEASPLRGTQKDLLDRPFAFTPPFYTTNQPCNMSKTYADDFGKENEKSVSIDSNWSNLYVTSSPCAGAMVDLNRTHDFVPDNGALDERQKLFEQLVMDEVPRWHEAVVVLQTIHVALEYEEIRKQMQSMPSSSCHRKPSPEEECAIKLSRDFERTAPFVQFLQTFRHISSWPILQIPPLTVTLRHCVQEWADTRNGITDALSHLSTVRELLELTQAAADVYGSSALSSPQSASEALLLAALTDICRYIVQLTCTVIPHLNYPFSGASMDSVISHNCTVIANSVEEQKNYKQMLTLLDMARSTSYYCCSEEVQASVSPLIAELLSIFDRFSLGSIEPLDKHKNDCIRCKLTGLKLESNSSGDAVNPIGRWYWERIADVPIVYDGM